MSKVGRPPAKDPRHNRVTIRLTDDQYNTLIEHSKTHEKTITETMLEAFEYFIKRKGKKA